MKHSPFVALLILGALVGPTGNAAVLTVNSAADNLTADDRLTLREAVLLVNHSGNAFAAFGRGLTPGEAGRISGVFSGDLILIEPGTYTLTLDTGATDEQRGDLDLTVSSTMLIGAGAAQTAIVQTVVGERVLEVNPGLLPDFAFTALGLTIRGGSEATGIGGGGLICGAPGNRTTLENCAFIDNHASGQGTPVGGAIAGLGGTLTVIGCRFEANSAQGGGGAIFYDSPTAVSVSRSTFAHNQSASNSAGGGALAIAGAAGNVTLQHCAFESNQCAGGGGGGALFLSAGTLDARLSRFVGNTAAVAAHGSVLRETGGTAENNWWSRNAGSAADAVVGPTITAWLQLRHRANPASLYVNQSAALVADLFGRNAGGPVPASDLVGLPPFPVPGAARFGNALRGTLSGVAMQFLDGMATATFNAGPLAGSGGADVTADAQTVTAAITILPNAPPVAGQDQLGTVENTAVSAPVIKLLANDTDPDGDTLSLTAVSPMSANGGTVVLAGDQVTYQPSAGFTGLDKFTYTLDDGHGASAQGEVHVVVLPGNAPSANTVAIRLEGDKRVLVFAGIPGQAYRVEWAPAVTGPWTAFPGNLTAGATGLIEFEDTTTPPPPQRFYRVVALNP
ncbi:MAG: hypothetical protein FJ387_30735 [Verrucomicrobia bacterium]|nr:hypothetical protein [Verrucomicrobiota bacterium]